MRIAIVEGNKDEILAVLQDFREQVDAIYAKTTAVPAPPGFAAILEAVQQVTGASWTAIQSQTRNRETAYARHLAMYLLRADGLIGPTEIGRQLGRRDHTTVIDGINRIEGEIKTRPETWADVEACRTILAGKAVE